MRMFSTNIFIGLSQLFVRIHPDKKKNQWYLSMHPSTFIHSYSKFDGAITLRIVRTKS